MAKIGVYKYVRTGKGWCYCKAAFAENWKIVQDMVIVDGRKETHEEGAYYLLINGQWVKTGDNAQDAANQQKKRLASTSMKKTRARRSRSPKPGNCSPTQPRRFWLISN